MTDTGDKIEHPGLTISVYRINSTTLERTRPVTRVLPAADEPVISLVFPPCECPRHRDTAAPR